MRTRWPEMATNPMWGMHQDLTSALRMVIRAPGFAVVAFGALTVGLSTGSAVFTCVDAYRRPFPGVDAENLVSAWLATDDAPWGAVSVPDFKDVSAAAGPVVGADPRPGGSLHGHALGRRAPVGRASNGSGGDGLGDLGSGGDGPGRGGGAGPPGVDDRSRSIAQGGVAPRPSRDPSLSPGISWHSAASGDRRRPLAEGSHRSYFAG